MHTKNHRVNHNFQIAHFLAGACHTPDGAYAMLCDLREDRQSAIEHYKVTQLRQAHKKSQAETRISANNQDYDAQSDLLEIEYAAKSGKILFDAAKDELAFIENCIVKIQPLRKFAHLPDPAAHEAAQYEEWKGELISRAENYLLTMGMIPTDQFTTMRQHPGFINEILPRITEIQQLMKSEDGVTQIYTNPERKLLTDALGE